MDHVEQWAAFCSVGRVTKVMLLLTGVVLLACGAYSLVTVFALTSSAESLELIAYIPLASFEKWQETQEMMRNVTKFIGFIALSTGIWGLWQHYYQSTQRIRMADCLLLNGCGFVFIYFVEITNCVSRMIDKIS